MHLIESTIKITIQNKNIVKQQTIFQVQMIILQYTC